MAMVSMTNDHAAGDDVVDDWNSDTSYEDGAGAGESLIIFAADDTTNCDGTVNCNDQLSGHFTWVVTREIISQS